MNIIARIKGKQYNNPFIIGKNNRNYAEWALNNGGEGSYGNLFYPQNFSSKILNLVSETYYYTKEDPILLKINEEINRAKNMEFNFFNNSGIGNISKLQEIWKKKTLNISKDMAENADKLNELGGYFLELLRGINQKVAVAKTPLTLLMGLLLIHIESSNDKDLFEDLKNKDIISKGKNQNGEVYYKLRDFKNFEDLQKELEKSFDASEVSYIIEILDSAINVEYKNYKPLRGKDNPSLERKLENIAKSTCTIVLDESSESVDKILNYLFLQYFPLVSKKEEWDDWKTLGEDQEKIKKQFEELIKDFLKIYNKKHTINGTAQLLGFFGELSSHGKSYFNIKGAITKEENKEKFEVYNTGNLYSEQTKELLSYDIVIKVGDSFYGIQTKNPFVFKDTYKVYNNTTYNLSPNNELFSRYLTNEVGSENSEIKEYFTHIFINSNFQDYRELTEQILYSYANNFMRIFPESIKKEQIENIDEIDNILIGKKIQNIFWVIGDKIIPSSELLKNLKDQYIKRKTNEETNKTFDFTLTIPEMNDESINYTDLDLEAFKIRPSLKFFKNELK